MPVLIFGPGIAWHKARARAWRSAGGDGRNSAAAAPGRMRVPPMRRDNQGRGIVQPTGGGRPTIGANEPHRRIDLVRRRAGGEVLTGEPVGAGGSDELLMRRSGGAVLFDQFPLGRGHAV